MLDFPEIVEPTVAPATIVVRPVPALDLTKVDLTDVALAQFGKWRDEVAGVTKMLGGVVHDLSTPTKLADAKSLRFRLIGQPRADARKTSKELKSKLAKVSKAIGAEEDAIVLAWDEAEKLITPQIDAREKEIADEEAARQRAAAEAAARDAARKKEITDAIAVVANYATMAAGKDSTTLALGIQYVESLTVDEALFAEFVDQAHKTKADVLEAMRRLHTKALADEDAARELIAQRAESARLVAAVAKLQRQLAAERAAAAPPAVEPTPLESLAASVEKSKQPVAITDEAPATASTPAGAMPADVVEMIDRATEAEDKRLTAAAEIASDFGFYDSEANAWVFTTDALADLIDAARA